MTVFDLNWDRGWAEVQSLAGMLGPITFEMDDGRTVQPMAVAPWSEDEGPEFEDLPNILKRLRGEWPCVPFGVPTPPKGLPGDWRPVPVQGAGDDFHGYSSHNDWSLIDTPPGGLELAIEYPPDHAIHRLTRRIVGIPGQTRIDVTLAIEPRIDIALPIALHPVFRLPTEVGRASLRPGKFTRGNTFPLPVERGISRLSPGDTFNSLTRVPTCEGSTDISTLPLNFETEELVQLCGTEGLVDLENRAEGYCVTLNYDPAIFPSILLWISNRGRREYPWNRRHLALGIEPVCGAFDLGPRIGCNPKNPIAAAGFPTAVQFKAGRTFTTTYSISVRDP